MCGIAGSLRSDWDVTAALNRIGHRGPDARGLTADAEVIHGHVRLSIQDPHPRSNQPYVTERGTLSFVGECWNWRELRDRWIPTTREWETEGDTEVVAAVLGQYGMAGLEMLEGMFALAWTDASGTYLARDRYGKVPLYFTQEPDLFGGGVTWASERKAWDGGARAAVVPAGHWIELAPYRENWAVPYYARPSLPGPTSAADVLETLRTAVRLRLQADVPVCCLVSGGLDSSLILALVREVKPDVVAYSAVFDPESPDAVAAREVCSYLGVEHREERVMDLGEAELRESIASIEVTSKTQVEIGTLCLPLAERISRDGFKVTLSGEGADELFGGYGTLARRSGRGDAAWTEARAEFLAKMGRSDFMRVNKAFMSAGVECRTPFLHRPLVERVLSLGVKECPPGKKLLQLAADTNGLLPSEILKRKKLTFQGGAGVAAHYEDLLDGANRRTYNEIAREIFGGIPRG